MNKVRFTSKHLAAFLKMDSFGQKQSIRLAGEDTSLTVVSRPVFFDQIYVPIRNNKIKIHDGTTEKYKFLDFLKWIEELKEDLKSEVVYVEGYAGCGKSVFVQRVLSMFFPNLDYDQNYYDYDVGAVYEETTRKRIRDAIVECFIREFVKFADNGKMDLINKFEELLRHVAILKLINDSHFEYLILNSKEYQNSIRLLQSNKKTKKTQNLKNTLHFQLEDIDTYESLCLDLILRIAKYIVVDSEPETLVVCYDNLDAIENYNELNEFDDVLGSVRANIDDYLSTLPESIFQGKPVPHFVLLATFRKVTAVRVGLHEGLERAGDNYDQKQHKYYIEGSHLYDFQKMVSSRYDYFENFCKIHVLGEEGANILQKIKKVLDLSRTNFVQKRYSGLWNNNYRTCCDIMEIIINDYEQDVDQCLELSQRHIDEYDDRLNVAMGASAVFLSTICKVQREKNYWDERHLNLNELSTVIQIPDVEQVLDDKRKLLDLTSPSRLILTYIRNVSVTEKRSIPINEIGRVFGRVYSEGLISDCLSNMLYRDIYGLWRRPIYLSNNVIKSDEILNDALCLQLVNANSKHPKRNEKYSEVTICDCGDAFINKVSCDFEYYAVRLGYETSIYLLNTSSEIVTVINDVLCSVEACCKKMKVFSSAYKKLYGIERKEEYTSLLFHPLTSSGSTQLHTERVIFNHIDYLDKFRLYVVENPPTDTRDVDLREFLLDSMGQYVDLYIKHLRSLDERRSNIASKLKEKIEFLQENKSDNETRVLYI